MIANTWLPEKRLRGFMDHDLVRRSVYEIMEAMGQKPTDAVQTIEAVSLDGEEADLLAVRRRSAAMLIRRVGYAHGRRSSTPKITTAATGRPFGYGSVFWNSG